jgi:hypothetical protein
MSDPNYQPTRRGSRGSRQSRGRGGSGERRQFDLSEQDWSLSMKISPRRRDGREIHPLRSLLLHRLTDDLKAVWRLPLGGRSGPSVFCESCQAWFAPGFVLDEVTCPGCDQLYELEFAIFRAVDSGTDECPTPARRGRPYADHPAYDVLAEGFRRSTSAPEHLAFLALAALDKARVRGRAQCSEPEAARVMNLEYVVRSGCVGSVKWRRCA